jgi:hypothetical protein
VGEGVVVFVGDAVAVTNLVRLGVNVGSSIVAVRDGDGEDVRVITWTTGGGYSLAAETCSVEQPTRIMEIIKKGRKRIDWLTDKKTI